VKNIINRRNVWYVRCKTAIYTKSSLFDIYKNTFKLLLNKNRGENNCTTVAVLSNIYTNNS